MTGPVPTSPQIPATPDQQAAAAVAAVKLVRASFEALALQLGQQLAGKVVTGAPPGLTQIAVADQVLTLKLDVPLTPGTQVQINVQPGPSGQPAVTITPQPAPAAAAATPLAPPAAPPLMQ